MLPNEKTMTNCIEIGNKKSAGLHKRSWCISSPFLGAIFGKFSHFYAKFDMLLISHVLNIATIASSFTFKAIDNNKLLKATIVDPP